MGAVIAYIISSCVVLTSELEGSRANVDVRMEGIEAVLRDLGAK